MKDPLESDELYRIKGDDPVLLHTPAKIVELLNRISETPQGRQVAIMLQVRYWSATPLFETFIAKEVRDLAEASKIRLDAPLNIQVRMTSPCEILILPTANGSASAPSKMA